MPSHGNAELKDLYISGHQHRYARGTGLAGARRAFSTTAKLQFDSHHPLQHVLRREILTACTGYHIAEEQ